MSDKQIQRRLRRYSRTGCRQVDGWFFPEDVELAVSFLTLQLAQGIIGNVAEIGIHHGKSFLLLANGVRADERAIALDVFDDQEKNVDKSGRGDRAIFEANVKKFAPDANLEILQRSSLDVAPDQARATFGDVRFFSVDGGHTAEITAHDLRLAEATLVPGGVVMLDDVLNPHWTGVISGVAEYLRSGGGLVPFAVSRNKLFLTDSRDSVPRYRRRYSAVNADLVGKRNVEFFDHPVDVLGLGSQRWREANAESARLHDRLRQLERQARRVETLEARLRALESSTSWRITAPLRALSSRVRR